LVFVTGFVGFWLTSCHVASGFILKAH